MDVEKQLKIDMAIRKMLVPKSCADCQFFMADNYICWYPIGTPNCFRRIEKGNNNG